MCVAEAGYDPALVWPSDDGSTVVSVPARWPLEDMWRALSLANDGTWDNQCFECFKADRRTCQAAPLTVDCGAR